MRLIVGLGNPGRAYVFTRHNIGVMVLEQAAARWGIRLNHHGLAYRGGGDVDGIEVTLAQPLAWMNQNGPVVAGLLHELEVGPRDLLVIHDDVDLPVGRLRIKREGGSGGHNGIRSIQAALQSSDFCRLKVGIGRPAPGEETADYVLSPFGPDDWVSVHEAMDRAVMALECWVREGAEAAMNRFNASSPAGA
ncbi:MAG TPA: aminoacyl-tRNA hydrolase [Nitrospiraceae bacterium]|nr:aminoacyl-tRNA hydrolase [Nitrospiraceae bacterium]